jgi:hypothetical protein
MVHRNDIENIINCQIGSIEKVLFFLYCQLRRLEQ